jgi:HSP20 family protein
MDHNYHQQVPFWDFVRSFDHQNGPRHGAGVDHPAGNDFNFFGQNGAAPGYSGGPYWAGFPFGGRSHGGYPGFGPGARGGRGGRGRRHHGGEGHHESHHGSIDGSPNPEDTEGEAGEAGERSHGPRGPHASGRHGRHHGSRDGSPNRGATEGEAGERPHGPRGPRGCGRHGRGGQRGWGNHGHGHGRRGPPPPFGGSGGPGGPGGFDLTALLESLSAHPLAQAFRDYATGAEAQRSGETVVPENADSENTFIPPIDIFSTEKQYILHVSLPGAKREDVGVNWDEDKGVLNLAGVVYRQGDEDFLQTLSQAERKVGVFDRAIKLPPGNEEKEEINGDAITAKLEDGILVVTVAKIEKEWTEVKRVDIE